jgi:hypothetical protein
MFQSLGDFQSSVDTILTEEKFKAGNVGRVEEITF